MGDCCLDDPSLENITFPVNDDVRQCSAHEQCSNLDGDCCPTDTDNVFLYCCDKINPSCSAHPRCVGLYEGPECCPTTDGVYLECCERPFAEPDAHPDCEGKTDNCCPDNEAFLTRVVVMI